MLHVFAVGKILYIIIRTSGILIKCTSRESTSGSGPEWDENETAWWALFREILEMSAFPDEGRVRELAEQIRARCTHAHQLKLSGQQATASGNLQVCFNICGH